MPEFNSPKDWNGSLNLDIDLEDLPSLPKNIQKQIVKQWFLCNYEDPVENTPYCSEEGGYIYIYGGPFDALEEIQQQFEEFIEFSILEEIARELEEEIGTSDWTSTSSKQEMYEYYEIEAALKSDDSFKSLENNLKSLELLLNNATHITQDEKNRNFFLYMMIFVFCITSLESYLSEVFSKNVINDENLKQKYIQSESKLSSQKIGTLLKNFKSLDNAIISQIQDTTFHNLYKVKQLYKSVLDIDLGDIANLEELIRKRHDFVHRGGKNKNGEEVLTEQKEIFLMIEKIRQLCGTIEHKINGQIPF